MDWSIPYTFYPTALPAWISWLLFSAVVLGALAVGIIIAKQSSALRGVLTSIVTFVALLISSMILSMIITFFVHDI